MDTRALLILGPTASGKTALAVKLAQEQGGEIVNMDSMQVYADLFVLTARPTREDEGGIPHHLFGHVDGAVAYSTGAWVQDAVAAIAAIRARGNRPILVGGTGLYAHALTEGLVETPPVPPEVRASVRRLAGQDPRAAFARLRAVDPQAAARIQPKDAVRIARALEVYEATGRSLSDWHGEPQPPALAPGTWEGLTLIPDREVLYTRIGDRLHRMLAQGALEEARDLWERQLADDLPVMKAHGMPGFAACFAGELSLERATERAILDTRHYAKRQLTWIRNRASAPPWSARVVGG
jgi:tRNA dimethylallyltransferase